MESNVSPSSSEPELTSAPKLASQLQTWVGAGLISAEQAARIEAYERTHARADGHAERPWALYGIAGIGVTALATGLISLIAANWDEIPDWLKLAAYFLLQTGVGMGFLRYLTKPGLVREVLLTLFALLFLAGIGLVAQVHHLSGDGWEALLFWLGLTVGVVHLAQSRLLGNVWVFGSLLTSMIWLTASDEGAGVTSQFGRACVVAALPFALTALSELTEKVPWWNQYFRKAALSWGTLVLLGLGTPLSNILWSVNRDEEARQLGYLVIPWTALLVAVAGVYSNPRSSRLEQLLRSGIYGALGLFGTLPFLAPDADYEHTGIKALAALGFFTVWGLVAAYSAVTKQRRWFDLASLVLAVRVIVVYFEVFGSLAMTGAGLILSGLVILTTAFAWHRFRSRVRAQLGGGV
jgi:uncharacterized membrane protein